MRRARGRGKEGESEKGARACAAEREEQKLRSSFLPPVLPEAPVASTTLNTYLVPSQ